MRTAGSRSIRAVPERRRVRVAVEGIPAWGRRSGDRIELEDGTSVAERDATYLAPVDPSKIIAVHLTYQSRLDEYGARTPAAPSYFMKPPTALNGHRGELRRPRGARFLNYEGELAVVIGRRARRVSEPEALDVVAGYMPFNDVSARDLQMQVSQWTAGKAIDSFAPCGPELVLAGEVGDVGALEVSTRLNGETVQSAPTELMIFSVASLVSYISSLITLEPGDVIATGTPAGVGFTREPPIALAAGDVVEVEIPGVGLLSNPVVAED
jgi:5-oxopent-3-ene-1,2,5-tricarboxylate decarboxylase / 2-hydroxyhepta-2,4-diene-1,7-dioate isomerase